MSDRHTVIGRHMLVRGDCGDMREVPDGGADAIVTSPPYADAKDYGDDRAGFKPDPGSVSEWFAPKISEFARVLRPGGVVALVVGPRITGGEYHPWRERLMLDMHAAGFAPWEVVTWHKKKFQPIVNRFGQVTEWIQLYFRRPGRPWVDLDVFRVPYSERSLLNMKKDGVLKRFNRHKMETSPEEYSGEKAEWRPHPKGAAARNLLEMISDGQRRARFKHYAAYPDKLARKLVLGFCPPGGIVVDPFSGTATTGVECEKQGRSYIGYEIVREWHDIGSDRMREVVQAE